MEIDERIIDFQKMVGAEGIPILWTTASRGNFSVRTIKDDAWCTCAYSSHSQRESMAIITAAALNVYHALSKDGIKIVDSPLAELIERSDAELKANSHKGEYADWQPGPDDLVSEIHHHADKLLAASDAGDLDEIKEHLADLFNYIRKGWEQAENSEENGG